MKLIKYLIRFFVIILICLILFIAMNYLPGQFSKKVYAENGITIYIVDNGVHTSIITPVKVGDHNWKSIIELKNINTNSEGDFNYLGFGWGDFDFYMNTPEWKDLNLIIALKAILVPSRSVIKVSGYKSISMRSNMKKVLLNEKQYGELFNYIYNSFTFDSETDQIIKIADGYGNSDGFYESGKLYHLFFTCNNWTTLALRRADVPTAFWPVLSSSVMRYLPDRNQKK